MLQLRNYALAISEKPDAAKKIARAIGTKKYREVWVDGVPLYVAKNHDDRTFVICYALGHLYVLEDPGKNRKVYPVFEVEWVPIKKNPRARKIINAISNVAKNAKEFVNACDYDQEGEVIGYNILKYACNNKHQDAYRVKFSTLTEEELREAFQSMEKGKGSGLADAGISRHVLDFLYGVNLSRALTQSVYKSSNRFRNLTIGRVQGPTLFFVVEREIMIRTHVPVPYWQIVGIFEKDDQKFKVVYEKEKVLKLLEVQKIVAECEGKDGKVIDVIKETSTLKPPFPFNLSDLQREAFRIFRFNPSMTLKIAERLYLDALISYPRTSSQKLPKMDYRNTIRKLGRINVYATLTNNLMQKKKLFPNQGFKDDPAHPAIHPTGETPKRKLEGKEWKLFDLIVKRFFSTFGDPFIRENTSVTIDVSGYKFIAEGRVTREPGWTVYYKPYFWGSDTHLPNMKVGDAVRNLGIESTEKHTQPPARFNQSSLVEKMEREGIGTKATRAEIVRTLVERGYITPSRIEATDLGFAIVETMHQYASDIISTELTRKMEEKLADVEDGKAASNQVVSEAVKILTKSLHKFREKEREIGEKIDAVVTERVKKERDLGPCPVCKDGRLRMIRSRTTGKRFVGCSHYAQGCRTSMPLPQVGTIKTTEKTCEKCKWPVVTVKMSRRPLWKMCINIKCPTKKK